MMKELLDDIEEIVDDDWKKIYAKHLAEDMYKRNEELKDKFKTSISIPRYTTYSQFYNELVNIVHDPYVGSSSNFRSLVNMILSRIPIPEKDNKVKSFEKVWSMFCDNEKFSFNKGTCLHCNKNYVIICEREVQQVRNIVDDYQIDEVRLYTVMCPTCGLSICRIAGSRFIGIFEEE